MQKNENICKGKTVIFVICLLVLSAISTLSQTGISIRGHVREYPDGQPLEEVEIYLDDAVNPADLTKTNGYYETTINTTGVHKVTARKSWYISAEKKVSVRDNVNVCDFSLSRATRIRVGAVLSVTGPLSFVGDPQEKTLEMIAKHINDAKGINGHKLELIIYDDKGDVSNSLMAITKLIERDEVSVILGPSFSAASVPAIRLAERHEIPIISFGSSYKIAYNERTKKPFKWVFKIPPSDTIAIEAIYSHLRETGIKKVALMSEKTDYGLRVKEELIRLADLYGAEILANESYNPEESDFTSQFAKIRHSKAKAIINWSVGSSQVIIARQRYDIGLKNIPLYQSPYFGNIEYIEQLGRAAEGVFCPQEAAFIWGLLPSDNPQKRIILGYLNDYRTLYNEQISFGGSYAWDAINLVVDAIKVVGPDRIQIRDYLEKREDFSGQTGIFSFSPNNHNGPTKSAFYITVVRNGKWVFEE